MGSKLVISRVIRKAGRMGFGRRTMSLLLGRAQKS
jgi:hypothetical protein